MSTVQRGLKLVVSAIALVALAACIQGCEVEHSDFPENLTQEWTQTAVCMLLPLSHTSRLAWTDNLRDDQLDRVTPDPARCSLPQTIS